MSFEERPDVRFERASAVAALAGGLLLIDWLVGRIWRGENPSYLFEFLGLFLGLIFCVYMGWLIFGLSKVTYQVQPAHLVVRYGNRVREIPLNSILNLYRWRRRWIWPETMQAEIGVADVEQVPPIWVGAPARSWVLIYGGANGERKAMVVRPSPELLAKLKAWAWEMNGQTESTG